MSATTTSTGAILGAATASGLLFGFIQDWQAALACMGLIMLLGLIIIILKRRRKNQEES